MKRALVLCGALAALALVMAACASAQYMTVQEPLKPDAGSAVVHFFGQNSTKADLWDSEKAVGTFRGGPWSAVGCISWRVTPGQHTLIAHSSNNTHMTLNLQANKSYYIEIRKMPSPSFMTIVGMRELTEEQEKTLRRRYRVREMSYSDEWRASFATGKRLQDVKDYLAAIKTK